MRATTNVPRWRRSRRFSNEQRCVDEECLIQSFFPSDSAPMQLRSRRLRTPMISVLVGTPQYALAQVRADTVSKLCHIPLKPPVNTVIYEDIPTRIDVA